MLGRQCFNGLDFIDPSKIVGRAIDTVANRGRTVPRLICRTGFAPFLGWTLVILSVSAYRDRCLWTVHVSAWAPSGV